MLKYKVFDRIGGEYIVSLDSDDPNATSVIEISVSDRGDERFIPIIRDWLDNTYGAFGHFLGNPTTPIDLDAAMHGNDAKVFRPEITEGQELVRVYDSGIPKGAVT